MSIPRSKRDLEEGNPELDVSTENEEQTKHLLDANFSGYQPSNTRNPEEIIQRWLGYDNTRPTCSASGTEPFLSKFEIEQEISEDEDKQESELGAGYQLSKPRHGEVYHRSISEPLPAGHQLPDDTSTVTEGKLVRNAYFQHSEYLLALNTSDQENMFLENQDEVLGPDEKVALLTEWNERGQTPLHACIEMKKLDDLKTLMAKTGPDVKDRDGRTVLRAAVDADWLPGVCEALRCGADVTIQAENGETPLHVAATASSKDELDKNILTEIVNYAQRTGTIDCLNAIGETALFNAVKIGQIRCIKLFLIKGASLKCTSSKSSKNVLHITAENGNHKVLGELLNFDKDITKSIIDNLTDQTKEGFAPIHYAVKNDNLSCVWNLIFNAANVCLKANNDNNKCKTPLEIAIEEGHYEIAKNILSYMDELQVLQHSLNEQTNDDGWFPLHLASYKGNEKFIKLLLNYKASLISKTKKDNPETALNMIIQHVTNPTEFLESILDSYILLDGSSDKATVSYEILMPKNSSEEEMEVVDELLKTGNKFEQKRLLLHPLIESFIYLKWRASTPFYFMMAAIYLMYMILLAIFALSVFDNIDNKIKPERFKLFIGITAILIFITMNIIYEVSINFMQEGIRYLWNIDNLFKLSSLALATIFALVILVQGWEEGARHVATGALLLTCIQMLNILAQCPYWGFYVVIFQKVTCNVAKILLVFAILIIGFALSFKLQLHSQIPFDNSWHAIVKTLFLLTSEFNYDEIFKSENVTNELISSQKELVSYEAVRILFVLFLIMIAIVLSNVMTGVAVDDINDLKIHGNIGRLEKQASCLRSIVKLKQYLTEGKPEKETFQSENLKFPETIFLEKDTVDIFIFRNVLKIPKRFKNAFFRIAQTNEDRNLEEPILFTESNLIPNQEGETCSNQQEKTNSDGFEELEKLVEGMNAELDVIKKQSAEILQFLKSLKNDKKAGL